jgi:LPXTG-motif cell wall-anchored protein
MKRLLSIMLCLVILAALLLPSAVLADPPPGVTKVYLNNAGTDYTPPSGTPWHFVLTGLDYASEESVTLSLYVVWTSGNTTGPYSPNRIRNHQSDFFVDQQPGGARPTSATYVNITGGTSSGNLVISSSPTPPVPEAPVVILLGIGLAGLGTFIFIKRRKTAVRPGQ